MERGRHTTEGRDLEAWRSGPSAARLLWGLEGPGGDRRGERDSGIGEGGLRESTASRLGGAREGANEEDKRTQISAHWPIIPNGSACRKGYGISNVVGVAPPSRKWHTQEVDAPPEWLEMMAVNRLQ